MTSARNKEHTYYELYLRNLFHEEEDPRENDDELIYARNDAAAEEYEKTRLQGYTVDQAHEMAMHVLLDGLFD